MWGLLSQRRRVTYKAITRPRYPRSPSSTPWFAIFAVSTYRSGIAGDAHPPASCSRSSGVPLRAGARRPIVPQIVGAWPDQAHGRAEIPHV